MFLDKSEIYQHVCERGKVKARKQNCTVTTNHEYDPIILKEIK